MNNLLTEKRRHSFIYFLVSTLLIIYLGVVVYKNIFCTYTARDFSGFGYTEFMINFQGGFVRRGLMGELLYWLCSATGFSPFVISYTMCVAAWIIVVSFFLYKFKNKCWNWWILMSPLFLGATFNMVRKDYLC